MRNPSSSSINKHIISNQEMHGANAVTVCETFHSSVGIISPLGRLTVLNTATLGNFHFGSVMYIPNNVNETVCMINVPQNSLHFLAVHTV